MATAAVGVRGLRAVGATTLLDRVPVSWKRERDERRHVIGGLVFGVGWTLAATCPGPVAAQVGRGQLSAVFTITGILGGVALVDRVQQRRKIVQRAPTEIGRPEFPARQGGFS
jgi:hypothetical protein